MKTMKKVAALLLALTMVLGLSLTAFAESEGSITIDNAVLGKTYTIYLVFNLEVDNVSAPTAYKYTLNDAWSDLATYSKEIDGKTVGASSFFTVNSTDGHIEWVTGASAADFAALLNAYQTEKDVTATTSTKATSSTVEFTGLELGYYFVQTDLGALCSLDTTNPTATIKEKNSAPSVDKQVQEDSNNQFGDSNTADIGDTVNFQTTIKVIDGDPKNYVLHDKMDSGLTYGSVTGVTVNGTTIGEDATSDGTAYYKVTSSDLNDSCTFEVSFYNLKPNDVIVVSYKATVNDKAVIGGDGNTNDTWLSYGESATTLHDSTTTYVYDVDILKYTTDKEENEIGLANAKFLLYKTVDGTNYYAKITDGKLTGWTTTKSDATTLISGQNGTISVDGLDADTYYLEETAAPAGYNQLTAPVTFVIDTNGNVTVGTDTTAVEVVKVLNNTGTELPETGGIGTTIFYVVGTILVLGAAVLLITKKRMTNVQ